MSFEVAAGASGAEPSHQPIDRWGTLASGACAAHCVLIAILPEALAAAGLGALLGHELEWGFTLTALALAAAALVTGWRKHRSRLVASLLLAGIASLLLAHLLEAAGETLCLSLSLLGAASLITGHLSNIRASRRTEAPTS